MIVMEHSCRLNVLCFLARSDYRVSCPFIIQFFSPVDTLSLLFHSFFTKHISRFFKEPVCGRRICNLSSHCCKLADHMHALFTQWHWKAWWICRTNNPMNPYTNAQCCILNVLYCLCNIISVLRPFFSVLVSPFSVNSIL